MVSLTKTNEVTKEDYDVSIHQHKRNDSINHQATNPMRGTHRGSLLIPSTISTTMAPVTPSPVSPHVPYTSLTLSTTYGSKATPSCALQQHAPLPRPYRFQTPSYVFNTEHSNHLEQLKGSAGCNCKKSRYV